MKINLPVIATVAAFTVLQTGYLLIQPANAAHPLLALAHVKKAVLADADNTVHVQVHVNGNDGTMTVNGQKVPAGQDYVQKTDNGSIQVTAPVIKKTTGPNGEVSKSTTSTSITLNGSCTLHLTPEQQALMQKNGGQPAGLSTTITVK